MYYYYNNDAKSFGFGFGFNTYDGGDFLPISDVTSSTVIKSIEIVES